MTAKLEVRGVSYSYHSLEGETLAFLIYLFRWNPASSWPL